MFTAVTTGGVGDTLICLVKIKQIGDCIQWIHGSANKEFANSIKEIQQLSTCTNIAYQQITNKNKNYFESNCKKYCNDINSKYLRLNTKIIEMQNPFLEEHLVSPIYAGDVCINTTAGRLLDDSKRIVSCETINNVAKQNSHLKVVLIGPEKLNYKFMNNIINLTGQTKSIIEAMQYVGGSKYFIVHDGIFAYYAAFLRKKCIINYHDPILMNHYWNDAWKKNVLPICQLSTIRNLSVKF